MRLVLNVLITVSSFTNENNKKMKTYVLVHGAGQVNLPGTK
jgi:hypothetical protein